MTWNSLYSSGCLELLTFCWGCGMSFHLAFEIILLAPNIPATFRILAFHPVLCIHQWWFCHREPHYACSLFAVLCHVHGMTLASRELLWRRHKAQYFFLILKSALATKNHVRLSVHIRKTAVRERQGIQGEWALWAAERTIDGASWWRRWSILHLMWADGSSSQNGPRRSILQPFVCTVK